jgi:hypothetical protein
MNHGPGLDITFAETQGCPLSHLRDWGAQVDTDCLVGRWTPPSRSLAGARHC